MKPIRDRDPGDETLFDPATTVPKRCVDCDTTRSNLCAFDADVQHGHKKASARRPKTCLNRINPATCDIPF